MTNKKLVEIAEKQGFPLVSILNLEELPNDTNNIPPLLHIRGTLLAEAREAGGKAVMTAVLPTYPSSDIDDRATGEPQGLLAPFAAGNYYKKAADIMKLIVREIRNRTDYQKRDFRIFVNSRYPEKYIAAKSGIGFTGKNSLIITREFGSLIILSGLILPFLPEGVLLSRHSSGNCGSCTNCLSACPVDAILPGGKLDTERCLQALSTREMKPEFFKSWGTRLYGCQSCQDSCPYNSKLPEKRVETLSNPGSSVSLKLILEAGDGVKELFNHTVLEQKWIEGRFILRNALVAAGNHSSGKCLEKQIISYLKQKDPLLREAAEWALSEIEQRS